METFTALRDFVDNPAFQAQRQNHLNKLNFNKIDVPIIETIKSFVELDYCFTLQSCYGHFLYNSQKAPHNIEPLQISDNIKDVEYRIAYVALCIENSDMGKTLFQGLKEISRIDPDYIQFGCADWFWQKQVNSYALQVEPNNQMYKDIAIVDYQEALYIEKIRNEFLVQIKNLLQKQIDINASG